MVEALVQQLKMLIVSIEKLEREIKKVFDRHADAEIFSTLPSAGDALAPRLLVAFGSDRTRYSSALDIQQFAGSCTGH
jgi:transposase